jgi:hypothetical protein
MMNDRYRMIVHSAAQMLLEAMVKVNTERQLQKPISNLRNKLSRLFAQQGKAYVRKFDKYQKELQEAITSDNIDALFDDTNVSVKMGNAIESAVETVVTLGAESLLVQFVELAFDAKVVFNLKNPRAVEYLKNYGVTRVSQIDDTSREILRKMLVDGIENGTSYSRMVTLLKAQFGEWSTKRAKLIAVTEMGNAYQRGNLIVGQDLAAAGLKIEKSWLTRGDDKVDPHCSANEAQGWIDVNKEHASGVMVPLDHPRCRCVELYRRKSNDVK